jgi:hypothetical protein
LNPRLVENHRTSSQRVWSFKVFKIKLQFSKKKSKKK